MGFFFTSVHTDKYLVTDNIYNWEEFQKLNVAGFKRTPITTIHLLFNVYILKFCRNRFRRSVTIDQIHKHKINKI